MSEIEIDQRRTDGSLRHLLSLEHLSRAEVERLLNKAQTFVRPLGSPPPASNTLAGVTVANLFTEPSTRTRVSFELGREAVGRGCGQPGNATLVADQGREHAGYGLYAPIAAC